MSLSKTDNCGGERQTLNKCLSLKTKLTESLGLICLRLCVHPPAGLAQLLLSAFRTLGEKKQLGTKVFCTLFCTLQESFLRPIHILVSYLW